MRLPPAIFVKDKQEKLIRRRIIKEILYNASLGNSEVFIPNMSQEYMDKLSVEFINSGYTVTREIGSLYKISWK